MSQDCVLTPDSECSLLTPDNKNIHCIEALENSAILDVLLPPYDIDDGRSCHYYTESPVTRRPLEDEQGRDYVDLQEIVDHNFEAVPF